jgi:ribulose-bisphosphate carboxylase large chain
MSKVHEKDASCDWAPPGGAAKGKAVPKTRLVRHRGDFSWSGVRAEGYKEPDGTWSDVTRRTLTGSRGERTGFHLRYFEVAPGGRTTHERHRHEHVIIGVRGRGRCLVRGRAYDVGFLDTLYIPPDAPHRITNPSSEPFGFFCLVDAKRDRPRPVKGMRK